MDISQLQSRIDAISWYHEFDFGNGLRARSQTPDVDIHRRIWRFIEEGLETIDFKDKTVLDVGCWDGYWSFYAERRGAKSVLAVDDFSQNWTNEAGLHLARELLGSQIQTQTSVSVYDLASLRRKFDVVLMLGVYYHLLDPFHAFAQLRHCCHPGTIVCIDGNVRFRMPENTAELNLNDASTKFYPTSGYLRQLLQANYFSVAPERVLEPPIPFVLPPLSRQFRRRFARKVLFGSDSEIRSKAAEIVPPAHGEYLWLQRIFLTCTAFEGENPVHHYKPPFGLHVFDPRFNAVSSPGRSDG